MNRIDWTDEFSVGIYLLDEQHKRLIKMINNLIDAHCAGADSEIISETLGEMIRYVRDHFADEERLMGKHGYADYAEHKEEHKEYLKKTAEFCEATSKDAKAVPVKLLSYLMGWWKGHILREDMKYKQFFIDKGLK